MEPPNPDDPIRFGSLLNEEERLIQANARRFVDEQVRPVIRRAWREGRFPDGLIPAMAEMGYFGASLEGYGCAGLSAVENGLVMQELESGDSGVRSFASVQGSLAMSAISRFGSEQQKQRWLPAMQAGRSIGCFALTEPAFGSNPSAMLTRGVPDGADWLLNGEKTWITNGSLADVAVVWAKIGRAGDEIGGFLVEKDSPGLTTSDLHNKLSMRASVTSSLAMVDCRVPDANRLPRAEGLKAALDCLSEARLGIGWGTVGAALDCYRTVREYVLDRKQFGGRPIASHQLVQQELAWMATEISKAQLLALHVSRLKDSGQLHHSHVSMLKRNNVWMALEVARRARDLLGANGITDEYPVFRHMANLETVKTYEGTHNIHTLVLGATITGIPAFE